MSVLKKASKDLGVPKHMFVWIHGQLWLKKNGKGHRRVLNKNGDHVTLGTYKREGNLEHGEPQTYSLAKPEKSLVSSSSPYYDGIDKSRENSGGSRSYW